MKVKIYSYIMRDEEWFPRVINIPPERELSFREQAQSNHSQTVERLNERGGLSPTEIYAAYYGVPVPNLMNAQQHIDVLQLCVGLAEGEDKVNWLIRLFRRKPKCEHEPEMSNDPGSPYCLVIDAPIPDDLRERYQFLCSVPVEIGLSTRGRKEKELIERISRLEAVQQDALEIANEMRVGTRNHPTVCSPDGDFKCPLCKRLAALKPASDRQPEGETK